MTQTVTRPLSLNAFIASIWAMERGYLDGMFRLTRELCSLTTVERRQRLEAVETERGEKLEYAYDARVRGGVAIIPVTGPISRYMDFFTYYSGGTAVSTLARDFNGVLNDPRVDAILFEFNTPGGQVDGVSELARMIFNARGKKPMTARVGGQCCSAGIWLASAVGDVVVGDTSEAGCVGVYCGYYDRTKFDAEHGFEWVEFRSKQSPNKNLDPTTPKGAEQLQRRLDAMGQVFVEALAEYYGVTVEKVLADFGGGDVLVGQAAVEAGLAHRLGSFEETLAELQRHGGGGTRFSGSVVKGRLVAGESDKDDDDVTAEEEGCPDHPEGDCPDNCHHYTPDADASALEVGRQDLLLGAPAPPTTPAAAAPATPTDEGAETMADEQENTDATTRPGSDAESRAAAEKIRADDLERRLAAVEGERRTERFKARAGQWPGEKAKHLQVLEGLAQLEGGEEAPAFKAYVEQQDALAEQMRAGKLFAQGGGGTEPEAGDDSPAAADAKLTARAKEIAREKSISFEKAYVEACGELPDLAALANVTVE